MISILISIILAFSLAFGNVAVPIDLAALENAKNTEFSISLNGDIASTPFSFEIEGEGIEGNTFKETYLNSKIKLAIEDEKVDFDLVIKDGAIYTTLDTITNIYLTSRSYIDEEKKYPELEDETVNAVISKIKETYNTEYVVLISEEEIKDYMTEMELTESDLDNLNEYENLSKKANNLFKDFFKDMKLPENILKLEGNTLTYEIKPNNVLEIIRVMANYMNDNKDKLYDTIIKFVNEINTSNPELFTATDTTYEEVVEELKSSKSYMLDYISEITSIINSEEDEIQVCSSNEESDNCYYEESLKSILKPFDGSVLKGEIKIENKGITYNSTSSIKYEDENILNLNANGSIKAVDEIVKVNIENPIKIDDLEKLINKVERTYEPYNKVTINWTSYNNKISNLNPDFKQANVHMYEYHLDDPTYVQQVYGANSFGYHEYHLFDDRIYLPLRAICEEMGYDVEWDNDNRKAYVTTQDGTKVDMSGTIVNDRTFIKIRDFEKLGFKVEYEQSPAFEGFYNEATLTTPAYEAYMAKVQENLNN